MDTAVLEKTNTSGYYLILSASVTPCCSRGPNWCWHMDGYDKLKPFGFPIHACIDGFSRKILWLEVATTNNDPYVVAHFYLRAVLKLAGCPTLVRADCGTENVVAALCQMVLRHEHPDTNAGKYSFLFGSSIRNSRIESWWSQLRKSRNDWWINFFKTLVSDRLYDPDNLLQRHIAGFVFLPLLRKELDEFKKRWNRHKIRNNRLASCPNGAPDDLYYLSAYQGIGAENCTRMISPDCLARCIKKFSRHPPPPNFILLNLTFWQQEHCLLPCVLNKQI
ncbi:hypothetical protein EMCRGX_G008155 [Ephydatia muelleri]